MDEVSPEGIGLGRFCFLVTDPVAPKEPGSSRFLESGADNCVSSLGGSVVVIMEGLNLDGVSDPSSTTSCGFVHFE